LALLCAGVTFFFFGKRFSFPAPTAALQRRILRPAPPHIPPRSTPLLIVLFPVMKTFCPSARPFPVCPLHSPPSSPPSGIPHHHVGVPESTRAVLKRKNSGVRVSEPARPLIFSLSFHYSEFSFGCCNSEEFINLVQVGQVFKSVRFPHEHPLRTLLVPCPAGVFSTPLFFQNYNKSSVQSSAFTTRIYTPLPEIFMCSQWRSQPLRRCFMSISDAAHPILSCPNVALFSPEEACKKTISSSLAPCVSSNCKNYVAPCPLHRPWYSESPGSPFLSLAITFCR